MGDAAAAAAGGPSSRGAAAAGVRHARGGAACSAALFAPRARAFFGPLLFACVATVARRAERGAAFTTRAVPMKTEAAADILCECWRSRRSFIYTALACEGKFIARLRG